jgi:sulfofructose kinase
LIEFDCIGMGVGALDYLCLLDRLPKLDEKTETKETSLQGGGPVPTALATLGKSGVKVGYLGKVGNDVEGEKVIAELKKFKVNTNYVFKDSKIQTPKAFIWIEKKTGKRTVVLNKANYENLTTGELSFVNKLKTKYLLIDGRDIEANLFLCKWAKRKGAEIILDVGSQRNKIERLFPLVDYLVASKNFAFPYTKLKNPYSAGKRLLKFGFKAVIITLGEKGAFFINQEISFYQPGFKVKVVDTTGAGDVFHGAFIYGLLQNWSFKKILEFSCGCAALKCRKIGGRAGIPSLNQVNEFLRKQK